MQSTLLGVHRQATPTPVHFCELGIDSPQNLQEVEGDDFLRRARHARVEVAQRTWKGAYDLGVSIPETVNSRDEIEVKLVRTR
jgi:GH43 family beta-xylosidase